MSSLLDRLNKISTQQEGAGSDANAPTGAVPSRPQMSEEERADELFYEIKHRVFEQMIDGVDDRAVSNADEDRLHQQLEEML